MREAKSLFFRGKSQKAYEVLKPFFEERSNDASYLELLTLAADAAGHYQEARKYRAELTRLQEEREER